MCTTSPASPPWSIIHFLLISLTAFTNHLYLSNGIQEPLIEAIMILIFVTPILFVQLKLGAMVQQSVYGLFHRYFPLLRGVAIALVVQMLIYQTLFTALPVHFICAGIASVSGEREKMASCANEWNTNFCDDSDSRMTLSYDTKADFHRSFLCCLTETNCRATTVTPAYGPDRFRHLIKSPIQEYFSNKFYQVSLPDDLGGFPQFPTFPLVLALTWIYLCLSVAFGPRVFAWVISIAGVLSTLMMIGVLGYGWNVIAKQHSRDPTWALAFYYWPDFEKLSISTNWLDATQRVMWLIPITFGILPTFGKFTGSGKVFRNISWVFVVVFAIILRHLSVLTISPYQYTAADLQNKPMQDYMMRRVDVEGAIAAFIDSKSSRVASFCYCLAMYLHFLCRIALELLVIVDNLMEAFHWLLKKYGCNRRVVWFITTAVISVICLLLGLPFVTRGGLYIMQLVDEAMPLLFSVTSYFLGVGIIVVYIWQNIATAERIIIGSWTFFAVVTTVVVFITNIIRRPYDLSYLIDGYILSEETNRRWVSISWGISSFPLYFIPVGMIIFIAMFVLQKRQSGNLRIDQPVYNEEELLTADENLSEEVHRVSSF